jgi:hypothetical protein
MYIGAECVWYKIEEDFFSFKVQDVMVDMDGNDSFSFSDGTIIIQMTGYNDSVMRIDWGDGTVEETKGSAGYYGGIQHKYPTSNKTEYEVKVYGKIGDFVGYYNGVFGSLLSCITEILTPFQSNMLRSESKVKLGGIFYQAKALRKVCDNLFVEYRDFDGTIDASGIFEYSGLEEVPSLLFSGLNEVDVAGCFANCANLTYIDASAFFGVQHYTRATNLFMECSSLKFIPSSLFADGFAETENFDRCFKNNTSLVDVPSTLFDSCASANSFVESFYWDSYITSKLPELWTRENAVGTKCFYNCARAENYWDIPSDWK